MEIRAHEPALCRVATFARCHRMLAPEKMGWKYKTPDQEHEAEIAQLIQHIHDKGRMFSRF
ncbi:hypothetical protein ACNKHP_03380 [Shigella boydii]